MLHQYAYHIKCKIFLNTLAEAAHYWFNLLEPYIIRMLQDFSRVFLQRFASSKKQSLATLGLFSMKKKEHESSCAYLQRFNSNVVEVSFATPDLLIYTFIQGLRLTYLFNSLVKKFSNQFRESIIKNKKVHQYGVCADNLGEITQERLPTTKGSSTKKSCSSVYSSQFSSPARAIYYVHFSDNELFKLRFSQNSQALSRWTMAT